MIEEGVTGFSFAPNDSTELSDLINRLLASPQTLKKMTRQSAGKYRTPDDYADDIEAEYKRALGNRGTPTQ